MNYLMIDFFIPVLSVKSRSHLRLLFVVFRSTLWAGTPNEFDRAPDSGARGTSLRRSLPSRASILDIGSNPASHPLAEKPSHAGAASRFAVVRSGSWMSISS